MSTVKSESSQKPIDLLGLLLIFTSSILLGIWAVKGTIALRNTLLGLGTPISFFYVYQYYKLNAQYGATIQVDLKSIPKI